MEVSPVPTENETKPESRSVTGSKKVAEFMLSRTCRTVSWSLRTLPRAVLTAGQRTGWRAKEAEPKQLEAGSEVDTDQLKGGGRSLVHALRETFGDKLNRGLIMRTVSGPRDIIVRATAHDSGVAHNTEAIIDVAEGGNVGHLEVRAVEPTMGAKHMGVEVRPATSIEAGGSVTTRGAAEALNTIQAACDQGHIVPYEPIGA